MQLAFCLFKYFPFGGMQRDFLNIAKECLERGHQIDVYTMQWDGEIPAGFNVHLIPKKGYSNHRRCLNFAKIVNQKLQKENYDCVIGFNKIPGLDVYFAADVCFQHQANRQYSAYFRWTARYRTFVNLERAVFGREYHCKILLLNEREKTNFISLYGTSAQRFYLLPPGIAHDRVATKESELIADELRCEFGLTSTDLFLLSIASDFNTKGLDRSIKALASLPNELRKKIHFFIIGGDKNTAYVRLAKKLGVAKNLIFLNTREDVDRFLVAADLLIHPARVENAGMVLIEALACGVPILTTANCGYAAHVQHAQAGIVLDESFSQDKLNQALFELLSKLPKMKALWSKQALNYITRIDIFSLAQEAATIIEKSHVSVA